MIHKIVTIYDSKAEVFSSPVFYSAPGAAIRSFGQAVNDPDKKHDFSKFPEDFTLFSIGEFDDSTGEVKPHAAVELAKGLSLIETDVKYSPSESPSPVPLGAV